MSVRVSPTEKIRAEIDALFGAERELGEVIEDVARLGARLIIQTALEAEVDAFLGRARYQRSAATQDARPGMRNGYSPATVKTTAGPGPGSMVGEIWLHGDNIANGYWRKPQQTQRTFGGQLVDPSAGTPLGPWLRTGDLGVIYDGELFIIGRIKDLLIVDGRNHYPDDIEATTQEISGGRVAAISIPDDGTERLVVIAEMKNRGSSDQEIQQKLRSVRQQVTSAISKSHGLRVADLVLVPPGSIPITTSGKIRRSSCVEVYRRISSAVWIPPHDVSRQWCREARIVASRRLCTAARVKPMPSIESSIPAALRECAGRRDKTG